jgi:hypothetical protein
MLFLFLLLLMMMMMIMMTKSFWGRGLVLELRILSALNLPS